MLRAAAKTCQCRVGIGPSFARSKHHNGKVRREPSLELRPARTRIGNTVDDPRKEGFVQAY
jgi:hypothetical protein